MKKHLFFLVNLLIVFSCITYSQSTQKNSHKNKQNSGYFEKIKQGCEDFDGLIAGGYVAQQLGGLWTTWNGTPGGSEDAIVMNDHFYSPTNSFSVNDPNIDLVFQLDNEPITTGAHFYSHYMYVPSGHSAYFNVQSEPVPGVDWVLEIFFNANGFGMVEVQGNNTPFSYEHNSWFIVEINFDMFNDHLGVYIDGDLIIQTANNLSIGSIDYFGAESGGDPGAYYDAVCFNQDWEPPVLDPPENLVADVSGEDILLSWKPPPGGIESSVLCVDRDGSADLGFTDEWQIIYPALDNLGIEYDYFEVTDLTQDGPGLTILEQYDIIFWFCGESWENNQSMSDVDEANLASFLDGGGKLLLSGQDYLYDRYPAAGNFATGQFPYDYLGVSEVMQDFWSIFYPEQGFAQGMSNSFASGLSFQFDDIYTTGKDGLYIDQIVPTETGLFEVTEPSPSGIAACQFDGGEFRSVFTSISFATISNQTTLEDVLYTCFEWFSSDESEDLTGYNIFYQYNGSGFDLLDNFSGTLYTHSEAGLLPGTHAYFVTAVYDGGSSDPSNTAFVLIDEVNNYPEKDLKIYPNPASEILKVEYSFPIHHVALFNCEGHKIYSEKANDLILSLDLTQYIPGVYFLNVVTDQGVFSEKIIVE